MIDITKDWFAKDNRPDTRNALTFGNNVPRNNTCGYNYTGLYFCKAMQGKMECVTDPETGKRIVVWSLSSSIDNERCQEKIKYARENGLTDNICYWCFSDIAQNHNKMTKTADGMYRHGNDNQKILASGYLNNDDIPTTECDLFRFESHADISSTIQLINYFKICEVQLSRGNYRTHFALWTKNADIVDHVLNDMHVHKPDNLTILVSSAYVNKVDMLLPEYWFVNAVFTVWESPEMAIANGHELNCCRFEGEKRRCATCNNTCYGIFSDRLEYRDELLRKTNEEQLFIVNDHNGGTYTV